MDDQHKVIFDVLDNQLKTKVESYVYHPEYIPFSQFEGLPLTMPLLGSGKGSQPFKTVKDYDNWLKRMIVSCMDGNCRAKLPHWNEK